MNSLSTNKTVGIAAPARRRLLVKWSLLLLGFTALLWAGEYVQCNTCMGMGYVSHTCDRCNGSGQETVISYAVCASCNGSGVNSGGGPCNSCAGSGYDYNSPIEDQVTCSQCSGAGYLIDLCGTCNGSGQIWVP